MSSLFDKKTHPKCYLTCWDRLQDMEKGRSIHPSTHPIHHASNHPSGIQSSTHLFQPFIYPRIHPCIYPSLPIHMSISASGHGDHPPLETSIRSPVQAEAEGIWGAVSTWVPLDVPNSSTQYSLITRNSMHCIGNVTVNKI